MRDIVDTVDRWLQEGKPVALATVAATWGSSPRQAGAKMAITTGMAMVGSVSGGCVESAVMEQALESIQDCTPRLLHYGVSDNSAWEVGLACGGKVSIYVEPLNHDWWTAAAIAAHHNRAAATVTVIAGKASGQKILVDAGCGVTFSSSSLDPTQLEALAKAASQALHNQCKTVRTTVNGLDVLVDVFRPDPRLVIIGGAHVAQALSKLAQVLGYQVIVIDPRSAFATDERFPGISLLAHEYPDKVLSGLALDAVTYIAILTHDPKIDDPALRVALPSPAPYVGVMSSKRTHQLRVERLTREGMDPALIKRIHVPIGLLIGAQSPEEIALSIMAEIVATRNAPSQPSPEGRENEAPS